MGLGGLGVPFQITTKKTPQKNPQFSLTASPRFYSFEHIEHKCKHVCYERERMTSLAWTDRVNTPISKVTNIGHQHSSKYLLLCSKEERNSFRMTELTFWGK